MKGGISIPNPNPKHNSIHKNRKKESTFQINKPDSHNNVPPIQSKITPNMEPNMEIAQFLNFPRDNEDYAKNNLRSKNQKAHIDIYDLLDRLSELGLDGIFTEKDMDKFTSSDLFEKLNYSGISISLDQLKEHIIQVNSVHELCNKWNDPHEKLIKISDITFVYFAIKVLWQRLCPEKLSLEQIDEEIGHGYELNDNDSDEEKVLELWWPLWEELKAEIPENIQNLATLENWFEWDNSLSRWFEILSLYLKSVRGSNQRLEFCDYIIKKFSKSTKKDLFEFKLGKAESLILLGDLKEGKKYSRL